MRQADLPRFTELIQALAASFGKECDEATLTGYEIGLRDLGISDIENGVARAIRERKLMPSAAELRELAGELSPGHRAVLAWHELNLAISRYGSHRSIDFDDKVINATIHNLGGWERICALPASDFDVFFRKDFERVYASLCRSGLKRGMGSPLIGRHDRLNNANGFKITDPICIETSLPPHRVGVVPKIEQQGRKASRDETVLGLASSLHLEAVDQRSEPSTEAQ